ncbi:hypothetical protein BCR39DRAFT_547539 [Naematelia encephala]|uniref:Uncharacterized protein n=1 Tax=Naematelia encephala TaxID=71784 RepID=A0A1Y2ANR9_9TREE|nr:hypothetical protein BCR39DRAFT_547539 [Naematelia encephala]
MKWSIYHSSSSSSSSSSNVPAGNPTLTRWEAILQDEERYQALQYPTPEDLPGCWSMLDDFMRAYALVPQLRSFYRYGRSSDSLWRWSDFKYCLSLKSETEEKRRELWIKRKAEWWAKRRVEGSSEDVWEIRQTPLENFPPLDPPDVLEDETVLQ